MSRSWIALGWALVIGLTAPLRAEVVAVAPGRPVERTFRDLEPGATFALVASIRAGDLAPTDRFRVTLTGPTGGPIAKTLHAGDPDLYLRLRPTEPGAARLRIEPEPKARELPVLIEWRRLDVADPSAIEAEPNDDPPHANPMTIGRAVYGSADDVDYLENPDEGRAGLDWFRIELAGEAPRLAYVWLDIPDRDVSANLRLFTLDADGTPIPYDRGNDPNETIHDRERERYSTHLSRVLEPGVYYLQVNANHPLYVLRSRLLDVPPSEDSGKAVEAGLQYLVNAGDAWFAQVPREGHAYDRSTNIHDTATRCTACHAAIFPTEAAQAAHRAGYAIASKDGYRNLIDRIANSPTPLYGPDGLHWQRYIAIPLQSQGMGGNVLMDHDAQMGGDGTAAFLRFAAFLRAAWSERTEMPADEVNGVVPLDSKFELAWRDAKVLREAFRRTGDTDYLKAADTIARLVADPASADRVQTLQDRVHRLYARHLLGTDPDPAALRDQAESIFDLQNDDGGWHEVDSEAGPSAVYTTGQIAWTLLECGYPPEDPRLAKALRFLLERQQPFGGWFQPETHENFRTPMRETRYAVMALARAYPAGPAGLSIGDRDGRPSLPPQDAPLDAILDALEAAWDVPEADRAAFARQVHRWQDHADPTARALAAEALGRLGGAESVQPLLSQLDDPSKLAWRSAASALRRLGNRGIGADAIGAALAARDPLSRRGASRIFAARFYGMDDRREFALRLLPLTDDPDLLTRLHALRALRQWFYRTDLGSLRRRIVYAYLSGLGRETQPVARRALIEGLYILMDENLGGGVSLQKNLAQLPEPIRMRSLAAREELDRDILLGPILATLESGSRLQREGLLAAFDGSFFRGRTYARRPTSAVDVGNDREFGFLHDVPTDRLDRTFAPLLAADLSPEARRQAVALGRFLGLPGRTASPSVRLALLEALDHPDPAVRDEAGQAVADLNLRGAGDDPATLARILVVLKGPAESVRPMARALAGERDVLGRPEILDAIRRRLRDGEALAVGPAMVHPGLSDAEAAEGLALAWRAAEATADRLALLDVLAARPSLINAESPLESIRRLLTDASRDPAATLRERILAEFGRSTPLGDPLILAALTDDAPAIRRLALRQAGNRADFWTSPEAREALLRLLIDPDDRLRADALEATTAGPGLADWPAGARRVKALADDAELRPKAIAALEAAGLDPAAIEADAALAARRLPSVALFRDRVDPLLTRPGPDGSSCISCHGNHAILRLVDPSKVDLTADEALTIRYNSALRVANLGDPAASLLLLKPSSPPGQGEADPSSPTGLTHVGGTRWGADDPSYAAIVDWIRSASSADRTPPVVATADGYSPDHPPALAVDGDPATAWSTEFVGARPGYPHMLTLDLGAARPLEALIYQPPSDGDDGRVGRYEVAISADGVAWSAPVASGRWPADASAKLVDLSGQVARYVRLTGLDAADGGPTMAAAEVTVEVAPDEPGG